MPHTNGHGPKRAILYARVSTDEQARSGYSLAQQIEALRAYAAREGLRGPRGGIGRRPERGQPGEARHGPRAGPRGRRRRLGGARAGSGPLRPRAGLPLSPARGVRGARLRASLPERQGRRLARRANSPTASSTSSPSTSGRRSPRGRDVARSARLKEGKLLAAAPRPRFGFRFDESGPATRSTPREMRIVRRIFGWSASRPSASLVGGPSNGRACPRPTAASVGVDDHQEHSRRRRVPSAHPRGVEPLVSPSRGRTRQNCVTASPGGGGAGRAPRARRTGGLPQVRRRAVAAPRPVDRRPSRRLRRTRRAGGRGDGDGGAITLFFRRGSLLGTHRRRVLLRRLRLADGRQQETPELRGRLPQLLPLRDQAQLRGRRVPAPEELPRRRDRGDWCGKRSGRYHDPGGCGRTSNS